jgi:hypothetical protein
VLFTCLFTWSVNLHLICQFVSSIICILQPREVPGQSRHT